MYQITTRIYSPDSLKGFLYGDKGYLTTLADKFKERALELITKYRKTMGLKALSYKKLLLSAAQKLD